MTDYVWCSFANDNGFVGACVVEAPNATTGIARADELGIAPKIEGVEALCIPFTIIDAELPAELIDHLRTSMEAVSELDRLIEPFVMGVVE